MKKTICKERERERKCTTTTTTFYFNTHQNCEITNYIITRIYIDTRGEHAHRLYSFRLLLHPFFSFFFFFFYFSSPFSLSIDIAKKKKKTTKNDSSSLRWRRRRQEGRTEKNFLRVWFRLLRHWRRQSTREEGEHQRMGHRRHDAFGRESRGVESSLRRYLVRRSFRVEIRRRGTVK